MFALISLLQELPAEGGPGWGERMNDFAAAYGPKVVGAVITAVVGITVVKILLGLVGKSMGRGDVDPTLSKFLLKLLNMVLVTVVALMVAGKLGVETTSFIAILGAATFAIGFALQSTLASFAAGVMIMIFRPFKVGDFVEAGGATGTVVEVGVFATTIKTGDNKKVICSNSGITAGNITNYSAYETRRVDMVFGIGYDDDIDVAKKILVDMFANDERVLKDPESMVVVSELADSSVNFTCRAWVKSGDYWGVYFDTHENVKKQFDAAGVSIPFPQQDVHMHQVA